MLNVFRGANYRSNSDVFMQVSYCAVLSACFVFDFVRLCVCVCVCVRVCWKGMGVGGVIGVSCVSCPGAVFFS